MTQFVAWMWQGAILTVVVEGLLRGMPRLNAATRHACWWGALLGIALLGALHFGASSSVIPAPTGALVSLSAAAAGALTLPALPSWLITLALVGWLGFAAYRAGCVLLALRHVARLRADARPAGPGERARLRHWSGLRAGHRQATLCLTARPVGACALGFSRPVILVSEQVWGTLDDEALDQVVLHEQAHLDRFDDWLRLGQAVITALVGVHPAVQHIARGIDLEREAACDDRVVSVTGTASGYASGLTRVAAVATGHMPSVAPAVLGAASASAGSLRARIVRLLDPRRDRTRRLAWSAALAVTAIVTAMGAAALRVDPVVVFASPQAPSTTAAEVPPAATAAAPTPPAAATSNGVSQEGPRATEGRPARTAGQAPASAGTRGPSNVPPPASGLAIAVHQELPPDGIGQVTVTDTHPPEPRKVEDLAPTSPGQPGAGASLASGVTQLGRNSATTARKMGLSMAGALTRAGKAIGRSF